MTFRKVDAPDYMEEVGPHYLLTCGEEVTVFPLTGLGSVEQLDDVARQVGEKISHYTSKNRFDWFLFLKFGNNVYDITAEVAKVMLESLEDGE